MHCHHCGTQLTDQANFCPACGTASAPTPAVDVLRRAKDYACSAATDMIDAGEELVTSDLGKKIAAGAAVGALVAAPVPIIGWVTGAAVGAGLVALKAAFGKQDRPSDEPPA